MITHLTGDCRALLDTLEPQSAQCIVTSPPYWRLRRYTDSINEIGQEATPAAYVAALADVFARCWRVLRDDGTLWLNLGDVYADDRKWGGSTSGKHADVLHGADGPGRRKVTTGLPPKSLIGLPWRVAFALQDAGWVLRSEIIWEKPNAMPESVTDRPTRSHEYVFLFAKSARYYYDAAALAEQCRADDKRRETGRDGRERMPGRTGKGCHPNGHYGTSNGARNARTVWTIPTEPLREEHYAPMPQALAERCIRAGSQPGDTVLDPFAGSGTTGRAALALRRRAILIDLGYAELQQRRTDGVQVELAL